MNAAVPHCQDTGAHRVFRGGNAVLSAAAFFATLVLSLVALNPNTSHYLLAPRHRTPALHEVGGGVMAGFTPVVVEVNHSAVLVVPAPVTALPGVNRVSRKLDFVFTTPLRIAAAGWDTAATESPRRFTTFSDVLLVLLLQDDASHHACFSSTASPQHAVPSTLPSHHRNVLHVCSALTCISPFVLQQWSNRGTAAATLHAHRHGSPATVPSSTKWPRLHNFALVFGEVERAKAMMRALSERHVMVPAEPASVGTDMVMPLIGKMKDANVVASCSPSAWCSYSTVERQVLVNTSLQMEADALTSPAAKARVLAAWEKEWSNAPGNVHFAHAAVRQRELSSLLFGENYTFQNVPFDVVYVDVNGENSFAAFVFLRSLAAAKAKVVLPRSILLSVYASEWVDAVLDTVNDLEAAGHYRAVPFVRQGRSTDATSSAVDSNISFQQWRAAQRRWLHKSDYDTPFLSYGRAAQEPLVVVLLSCLFPSPTQLQDVLWDATAAAAAERSASSPMDRFFFRSLNVTLTDEAQMSALFDDAENALVVAGGFTSKVRSFLHFVVQYIYFVIPLTVAGVLVWSLCRPRRTR